MAWSEPTKEELVEAQEMAEAVNGGDWNRDYTDVQQRGWVLKVRWARTRYGG